MPSKRRSVEFFKKLSFRGVPWGMQDSASDCCLDSLELWRIFLTNGTMPEGACVFHRWANIGKVQVDNEMVT